jgi:CRP-like cAMP-binding protein
MNELLSKFRLLEELPGESLEELAPYLDEQIVDSGRALYRAREEASALVFVVQGRLRLEQDGVVVGGVGEGKSLGGASLALIGRRECDAIADADTRVLLLSRESYLRLRIDRPDIALVLQEALLRSFAQDVRAFLPELDPRRSIPRTST